MGDEAGYTYIVRALQLIFRSPISITAALSVVALLGVITWKVTAPLLSGNQETTAATTVIEGEKGVSGGADWQQEMVLLGLATTSENMSASDTDPVAMIGPIVVAQLVGQYAGLVDAGSYTKAAGEAAALSIAENMRGVIAYKTYEVSEIKTDANISHARMLTYRSDLRDALAPLLLNTESEFEIYAKYIETSDAAHLVTLQEVAKKYREAAKNTAAMVIPRDAVNYHRDILNAMEQFAATLDAMARNADDAFGSVALLRNYNSAEQKMFISFDALGSYYGQKTP